MTDQSLLLSPSFSDSARGTAAPEKRGNQLPRRRDEEESEGVIGFAYVFKNTPRRKWVLQ